MSYTDTETGQDAVNAEFQAEVHRDRETALQQCSQAAAKEIAHMRFETALNWITDEDCENAIAAIIYKHMRLGREL